MRIAVIIALAVLAPVGCALPLDEGREFRHRFASLTGQPASILLDELGPIDPEPTPTGRLYVVQVIGYNVGGCIIEADADEDGIITSTRLEGSDYSCGRVVIDLRRRAARYRADPGLKAREEARMRRILEELVGVRHAGGKRLHGDLNGSDD